MVSKQSSMDTSDKKYIVIDNYDNIEYLINITTNDKGERVYKLSYSNSEIWTSLASGKVALTMTDTRNGIKFKFSKGKNIKTLDYGDVQYLKILITLQASLEGHLPPNIVEVGDEVEAKVIKLYM